MAKKLGKKGEREEEERTAPVYRPALVVAPPVQRLTIGTDGMYTPLERRELMRNHDR